MKKQGWSRVLSCLPLLALAGVLAKNVAAGSGTLPREADVRKAARTETPAAGVDEHAPLATSGLVSGNGGGEPADREDPRQGRRPRLPRGSDRRARERQRESAARRRRRRSGRREGDPHAHG